MSFLFLEAVGPLRIFGDHLLRIRSSSFLETALFSRGNAATKGMLGRAQRGRERGKKETSFKELHKDSSVELWFG